MKPFAIPFPTTSANQTPARAGVGRLLNVILELLPGGKVNYKRAPGIASFALSASGSIHCRGMLSVNNTTAIVVYNDYVELVDDQGNSSGLGGLGGSDLVSLAINNKTPTPDIVCVSPQAGAYSLSASGPPVPYPDVDIGFPNSVCYLDGYFFFTYGNGEVQASGINSLAINPLDKIIVSSRNLMRGVTIAQTLFLFTESSIEAWTNAENPTGFPFSRSAIIPRGLLNADAVAGFESGFTSSLIWVGSDNIVYLMRGYSPYRISTSDIETRINNVVDKSTLRACVYMSNGHAMWQLTCSDFTLCYDLTNSVWTERNSNGLAFSRVESAVFAFGEWVVGDYSSGLLGIIDADSYTEYGDMFTYSITSFPASTFPYDVVVKRADFNFIAGTGLQPGPSPSYTDDPQVLISWSENGGASFTMPLQRSLGAIGKNNQLISVLRTGKATRYGRVWRLEVSDPVYVGLLGGTMER